MYLEKIKNKEVVENILDLAYYMKTHNLNTNSSEFKKARDCYYEMQDIDLETARDEIIKNNLLNLKEYFIFMYLYKIKEADKSNEVFSFAKLVEEAMKLLP